MRSGLEKRLARLYAPIAWQERRDRLRRIEWRGRVLMGRLVRECFADWGIDAARAPILRSADEAAAELAKIHDGGDLECGDPVALGWKAEMPELYWLGSPWMLDRAERYWRDRAAEPEFERTSLADIVAWCLARLCGDAWFGDLTGD